MDDARAASPSGGQLLRIGRVTGIHGLAGAIRFKLDNPESPAFDVIKRVQLAIGAAPPRTYEVREVRPLNHGAVKLTLEGIRDPSAAEALKGAVVFADAADLPPADTGEFYYFEVIGCAVRTTDGRELGKITEVFATGANDVWIVRDGNSEVLVPVIEDVVKSMDFAGRRMLIEAVPGLLD
jgi:16S rRNA processing protein RimM